MFGALLLITCQAINKVTLQDIWLPTSTILHATENLVRILAHLNTLRSISFTLELPIPFNHKLGVVNFVLCPFTDTAKWVF